MSVDGPTAQQGRPAPASFFGHCSSAAYTVLSTRSTHIAEVRWHCAGFGGVDGRAPTYSGMDCGLRDSRQHLACTPALQEPARLPTSTGHPPPPHDGVRSLECPKHPARRSRPFPERRFESQPAVCERRALQRRHRRPGHVPPQRQRSVGAAIWAAACTADQGAGVFGWNWSGIGFHSTARDVTLGTGHTMAGDPNYDLPGRLYIRAQLETAAGEWKDAKFDLGYNKHASDLRTGITNIFGRFEVGGAPTSKHTSMVLTRGPNSGSASPTIAILAG